MMGAGSATAYYDEFMGRVVFHVMPAGEMNLVRITRRPVELSRRRYDWETLDEWTLSHAPTVVSSTPVHPFSVFYDPTPPLNRTLTYHVYLHQGGRVRTLQDGIRWVGYGLDLHVKTPHVKPRWVV